MTAIVQYSSDTGSTYTQNDVGTNPTGGIGGFDMQRSGSVSYAAMAGKIRKATALGGSYSDFAAFTSANPVCCIIPYYRRNTNTSITSSSTPDVIVALDGNDSDGHALYWVNGITAAKTNIEPVAGIIFDKPDCVMVRGGYDIVCFGKVSGIYKLYYSINGGSSWTFVKNLTAPTEIRKRRNDTRLSGSPARGQVYLADSNMYYSSYLAGSSPAGGGVWIRKMPDTIIGFDTVF